MAFKWNQRIVILCILILGWIFTASVPSTAHASGITGGMVGQRGVCQAFAQYGLIERIVRCLTDNTPVSATNAEPKGAIPKMVYIFMKSPYVTVTGRAISSALLTLGVIFFAIKLMYMQDVSIAKKDMWLLAFKIGGITYFLNDAYGFYSMCVGALDSIMDAFSKAISVGICRNDPNPTFWTTMDCMFTIVFGVGAGTGVVAGFLIYIVSGIMSGGTMLIIGFFLFGFLLQMVFVVARVIHLYAMSFIGLAFMFSLSFLFVPCYFFEQTRMYFDKWLRLTIGYILTPVFLFAYLGFAFIAIKFVVLCDANSFFVVMAGTQMDACTGSKSPGDILNNGAMGNNTVSVGTNSSNPGEANEGTPLETGQGESRQSGSNSARASSSISVTVPVIDPDKLAADRGAASTREWFVNTLIALLASLLLMYVLYHTLDDIPKLSTALAHGGFAQGSIANERPIGEIFAIATVNFVKDIALGAATGGYAGAARAAAAGLNQYRKDISFNDPKELR